MHYAVCCFCTRNTGKNECRELRCVLLLHSERWQKRVQLITLCAASYKSKGGVGGWGVMMMKGGGGTVTLNELLKN